MTDVAMTEARRLAREVIKEAFKVEKYERWDMSNEMMKWEDEMTDQEKLAVLEVVSNEAWAALVNDPTLTKIEQAWLVMRSLEIIKSAHQIKRGMNREKPVVMAEEGEGEGK